MLKYALAGNPNCGKTTLFNRLTGSNQYVGNWPGVTVEKKEGRLKAHGETAGIVDLPGIYSLSPYSAEEIVARNYLLESRPDVIINVVDAVNLERNLYLTLQLAELGRPMIIALNMTDMLRSRGMEIDAHRLEHLLGIPVVPISAGKGTGVRELIERARRGQASPDRTAHSRHTCEKYSASPYITGRLRLRRELYPEEYGAGCVADEIYSPGVMEAILRIEDIIAPRCIESGKPLRWTAVKLLDGDQPVIEAMKLSKGEAHLLDEIISGLENRFGDRDMIAADQKYRFICEICRSCVTRTKDPGALTLSDRIDMLATHKYLAIPLFLGVIALVFFITFGPAGSFLTGCLEELIGVRLTVWAASSLESAGASAWAVSLVTDGIITGVGSIVSFFPQILLLFFFMSVLEDSGYMARAAFIMDKLMHRAGLSGRSFVPMLMGFGCSVPGIMAARTLENDRDRRMTIMLIPFMSCPAKMPVYALFIAAFFPRHKPLVVTGIYFTGVLTAILVAMLLHKTVLKGSHAPFVMELPAYRLPTLKTLWMHMYDRIKDFAVRAGTILLAASVLIWFLQSFSLSFPLHMLEEGHSEDSILAALGKVIAPVFRPLGFGFWQAAVALISGFAAKEAVVGTLSILYGASGDSMTAALQGAFTPASALSFLTFVLLYMPCIAAFAVTRRELNSLKWAVGTAAMQTGAAWAMAFIVYQFAALAGNLIGMI